MTNRLGAFLSIFLFKFYEFKNMESFLLNSRLKTIVSKMDRRQDEGSFSIGRNGPNGFQRAKEGVRLGPF